MPFEGKTKRFYLLLVLLAVFAVILGVSASYISSAQNNAAMSVTLQKFESLTAGQGRVAVFFSAQDCPNCGRMRPLWQELSMRYGSAISFIEVRYSIVTSAIFEKYNVYNTPTFVIFASGANVSRFDGVFVSSDMMVQFIQVSTPIVGSSSSNAGELSFLPAESPSLLISAVLGVGVFASPCVLPLLPGYLGFLVSKKTVGGRRLPGISSILSFAAGAAGILSVGVFFILLGSYFWSLILGGRLLISFALMTLGLASLLGLGIFFSAPMIMRVSSAAKTPMGGISAYSFLYGVVSLGCSLPLMVGAMLNILAGFDTYSMVCRLLAFAIGFATPMAILTFASGMGAMISAAKLGKGSSLLQKIGGLTMVAASILLLITSI